VSNVAFRLGIRRLDEPAAGGSRKPCASKITLMLSIPLQLAERRPSLLIDLLANYGDSALIDAGGIPTLNR
jgi:hypothetical protein